MVVTATRATPTIPVHESLIPRAVSPSRQAARPGPSATALWRDRSAIEFAHQLRAKLLMIHGANDPRCPVSQSRIFRDRLLELGKREGVDFEYVEYDDAGHGSVDPDQKTRTFRILLDFLDRVM
jgi:dipeptidyl aminopeptidase/acylaminoacyl peptidase